LPRTGPSHTGRDAGADGLGGQQFTTGSGNPAAASLPAESPQRGHDPCAFRFVSGRSAQFSCFSWHVRRHRHDKTARCQAGSGRSMKVAACRRRSMACVATTPAPGAASNCQTSPPRHAFSPHCQLRRPSVITATGRATGNQAADRVERAGCEARQQFRRNVPIACGQVLHPGHNPIGLPRSQVTLSS
jgi:hypothetical protein